MTDCLVDDVRWHPLTGNLNIAGHVHPFGHGRLRRSIVRHWVRSHPDQREALSK